MNGGTRGLLSLAMLEIACGDDAPAAEQEPDASVMQEQQAGASFGTVYSGGEFHLGPVDYEETAFHNACASEHKYAKKVRQAQGKLLAGVWNGLAHPESLCDACIRVTTEHGKTADLRVVTYGDTTKNSLDVSPEAYALLNSGEYPRAMTWQLVACAQSGDLMYEFKSGSNAWWTAFWVRNGRLPVQRVEVMGGHHAWATLKQESDGSWVDDQGVGEGAFSIRVTSSDGKSVTSPLDWSGSGLAGKLVDAAANL